MIHVLDANWQAVWYWDSFNFRPHGRQRLPAAAYQPDWLPWMQPARAAV